MDWLVKSLGDAVLSGSQLVKVVESTIEDLDASVKEMVGASSVHSDDSDSLSGEPDDPELRLTDQLKDFAKTLAQKPPLFLQHPMAATTDFNLSPQQQRHAKAILTEVPEFSRFRYRLSPSQIQEVAFWRVYFDLIEKFVREQAGKPSQEQPSSEKDSEPPTEAKKAAAKVPEKAATRRELNVSEDLVSESLSGDFLEVKKPNLGRLEGEDGYITDFSTANSIQTDPVPV